MSEEPIIIKPGVVIKDRYEVLERVARGGFAVVWKAHDRLLGKDVALKILHEAIVDDEGAVEDLKRETLRSRELTHENIVQTFDFVQDGSTVAIAMEYIEGETLATLASRKPNRCLEAAEIGPWVASICDALDYAHAERGAKRTVVHHDVKPGNFMVDKFGTAKVLDFGISKTVSETRFQHTGKFVIAGTPPYMSPQQLRGKTPKPSDDIYSFGATIYALLTSKPPFYRGDVQVQIPSDVPPSIADRREELEVQGDPIPPEWEEVVAACLAKEPELRPASMAEVAVRLGVRDPSSQRAVTGPAVAAPGATKVLGAETQPTGSGGTPLSPAPVRAPKKWMPRVIGGGVVAIAIAVAVAMGWFGPTPSDDGDRGAGDRSGRAEAVDPGGGAPGSGPDQGTRDLAGATGADRTASNVDPSRPSGTNSIDPLPDERTRAIDALRREAESAAAASRWSATQDAVTRLLELLPDDPAALALQTRAQAELDRTGRIRTLKRDIPRLIDRSAWDDALAAVSELRELAPGDRDAARWAGEVDTSRSRAARVEELRGQIRTAMETDDWPKAHDLLSQLDLHAPGDAEATTWRATVDDQMGVRGTLENYRTTQESLNATAYRSLWLQLSDSDFATIQRSYGDMRSQEIRIDDLEVEIRGDIATARFREERRFDLRAGGHHDAVTATRLVLRKTAVGTWKISARSVER